MYPWLWLWAPQLHFPWSGNVAQRIEPNTEWFFEGIKPGAGNPRIEQKAFDVASYGKQLGLITDILIDLADRVRPTSDLAALSLERLKTIRNEIERIKTAEYASRALDIEAQVLELKRKGGPSYTRLAERLLTILRE
jgi:hypothetical protein